jgi:hypothetical protein
MLLRNAGTNAASSIPVAVSVLVVDTSLLMVHRLLELSSEFNDPALHKRVVPHLPGLRSPARQKTATIATGKVILTLLTFTRTVSGSDMIAAVMMPGTISITPGSTGVSGVVLAPVMSGG